MYEVSKVWLEKEKEIKEHLKNSCKALEVSENEYKKLIEVIDANKEFMMKVIEVTQDVYGQAVNRTLPPLIMGQHQIAEYEKQKQQVAAPGIQI